MIWWGLSIKTTIIPVSSRSKSICSSSRSRCVKSPALSFGSEDLEDVHEPEEKPGDPDDYEEEQYLEDDYPEDYADEDYPEEDQYALVPGDPVAPVLPASGAAFLPAAPACPPVSPDRCI